MSKHENELDEYLAGKLRLLAKVSPLDPQMVGEERKKFLAQGAMMRAAAAERPSQPRVGGIQAWVLALRGRQRSLSNMMVALVLALAMIMGSMGATVFAAQQSLPDEILYPVKTLSEDALLVLSTSSDSQLELMLDYSNKRLEEIAQLRSMGKTVPEATVLRAQEQLDSALQIAADMNDQQLVQALDQIRQRAQDQSEQMKALMGSDAAGDVDPALAQLQVRLQAQAQLAAEGQTNPEGFRQMVRAWEREHWRVAPFSGEQDTTPDAPNGNNGNQPSTTPGQYGPGTPNYNQPSSGEDPGSGGVVPTEPEPSPDPSSRP